MAEEKRATIADSTDVVEVAEDTDTVRRRAERIARARLAENPALASTDDRTRPVAITSTDEAGARAGLQQFEVETADPADHRTVHRVRAATESDAVDVLRARVVRPDDLAVVRVLPLS